MSGMPSFAEAAGSMVISEVTTVSSVTSLRVVVAPESVRVLTAELTSRVRVAVTLTALLNGSPSVSVATILSGTAWPTRTRLSFRETPT